MTEPELVRVSLIGLPVALWQQSQEHGDELLREFMLIASERQRTSTDHDVPVRLTSLIDELTSQYAGFSEANERLLADAADRGLETLDLEYDIPAAAAGGASRLGDLLDEADDYCRRGEHLLTLATPPMQVAFRRWYLDEFVRQIDGGPPRAWADYPGRIPD
jgi:hypothetical protein